MREELTLLELEEEQVELLPSRETLFFHNNWAYVVASNSSLALNAASYYANALSSAHQNIWVSQH
jgi:hypothetical protein